MKKNEFIYLDGKNYQSVNSIHINGTVLEWAIKAKKWKIKILKTQSSKTDQFAIQLLPLNFFIFIVICVNVLC